MGAEKFLIIDTETNDLPNYKLAADDDAQPRLAELAMIRVDLVDGVWKAIHEHDQFVKPDGWLMKEGATAANGLTTEFLLENGVPLVEILRAYSDAIKEGRAVIAHNAQFDLKIMRGELRRNGMDDLFEFTPNTCTMRALTPICNVPFANGRRGAKWPTMAEAMNHFEIPFEGQQHTALADARGVFQLFMKLKEIDALPEPVVHYAKGRA